MLKKKVVAMAGALVITVSLLAGVTYAWFTNTQADTAGTITAGKLGIAFEVSEESGMTELYPVKTNEDGTPDENGKDVATISFELENASDRQVLVKVSGSDLLNGGNVMGSQIDPDTGNAKEGALEPVPNPEAVKISYDFGANADAYRKGNDAYIFLPTETATADITVKVWIDGAAGDSNDRNRYQNAEINLSKMTAIAVQYREAAIEDTFTELDRDDLRIIEDRFGDFE